MPLGVSSYAHTTEHAQQPYLKLPDLASIGRATPSKVYKDGDIVHTSLSYDGEASTDDRLNYVRIFSNALALYMIALLVLVIVPNFYSHSGAKANVKQTLDGVCAENEILYAIDCNGGYFCADPELKSIVVTQKNKFYLQGTGQEHKHSRDYVIGRIESFVSSTDGQKFVKASEGAESAIWSPVTWLYNQLLLHPTQARPHLHAVDLKDENSDIVEQKPTTTVVDKDL